jgi:Flp pilus assembly protein TadG
MTDGDIPMRRRRANSLIGLRSVHLQKAANGCERSKKGVVMGVADLVIMIPLFVAGVFFLGDLAQMGACKERLSSVLTQAANYAVTLPSDVDPAKSTEPVVKQLCAQNNLTINNIQVQVKKITIADSDAISVKATGYVPLLQGGMLPAAVSIQDAAVALYPANRVYGVVAISPYPYSTDNPAAGQSVYIPIIRPRSGVPVWQFPYDSALNNLHVVEGPAPSPLTAESTSTYFRERPSLY